LNAVTGHASIEAIARRLRELVRGAHDAGINVTFACEQKADDTVVARASVFAPEDQLSSLKPLIRCAEIAEFEDRFFEEVGRALGRRDYECRLGRGTFRPDARYHLTLHPFPGGAAMAAAVVHTFSKRVVADMRRRLCDIVMAAEKEAPPTTGRARSRARR